MKKFAFGVFVGYAVTVKLFAVGLRSLYEKEGSMDFLEGPLRETSPVVVDYPLGRPGESSARLTDY